MDEFLAQFLIEGPELVQAGADALLALERHPGERNLINDAFRAIHTLKGSVGLFDLPAMATVLHAAEDLLAAARDGQRELDPAATGQLLAALDQIQAWLNALGDSGALPDDTIPRARRLAESLAARAAGPADAAETGGAAPAWALALRDDWPAAPAGERLTAIRYRPDARCYFAGDDPMALLAQAPGLVQLRLSLRREAEPSGTADRPYDPFTCILVIEALCRAPLEAVKPLFRFVPDQAEFAVVAPSAPDHGGARPADNLARTLRIDAERVETLAAAADELIAVQSGLGDLIARVRQSGAIPDLATALAARFATLDRIAAQLHRRVAGLRMAPVRQLLRRFPRVARDLSALLGKTIELRIEGGEIEADREVVEGLFEPLTHLLRNAIDHGVESAEDRRRAGKPATALIMITAASSHGLLNITVRDDGRGMDAAAIRAGAIRKGLADPALLAGMSDQQAIELIFLPGFSTAEAVTAVSGRGVGMDAIRTAVRRLGGRVSIATAAGAGTAIELSLPLTIALTQVMVVNQGNERFGLPLASVIETLRLPASRVAAIRSSHAFNWRDQAIPLLSLAGLTGAPASPSPPIPGGDQPVLVVKTGATPVGLTIDRIENRLDLAVRPLRGLLAGMPGLAGAAVMGDGQVLMILDPETLIA